MSCFGFRSLDNSTEIGKLREELSNLDIDRGTDAEPGKLVAYDENGGFTASRVTLLDAPILDAHASTKSYVDTQITDVRKIGTSAATPNTVVRRDANGVFAASQITIGAPTASNHVANKEYVDAIAAGLAWKQAVRLKTVGQLPAYTYSGNGTLTGSTDLTVDGVLANVGDRILVDQNNSPASHSGIYVVTQANPFILERSEDADGTPANEYVSGICLTVSGGVTGKGTQWILSTPNPITLGVTEQLWVMFSAGGTSDPTPNTLMMRDSRGDVSVRSLVSNGGWIGSTGFFNATPPPHFQGAFMSWNRDSGMGRTCFINGRGGGGAERGAPKGCWSS